MYFIGERNKPDLLTETLPKVTMKRQRVFTQGVLILKIESCFVFLHWLSLG